jgi:hypothetical protein
VMNEWSSMVSLQDIRSKRCRAGSPFEFHASTRFGDHYKQKLPSIFFERRGERELSLLPRRAITALLCRKRYWEKSLNPTSCLLKYPKYLSARPCASRNTDLGSDRICNGEIDGWTFLWAPFSALLCFRRYRRPQPLNLKRRGAGGG